MSLQYIFWIYGVGMLVTLATTIVVDRETSSSSFRQSVMIGLILSILSWAFWPLLTIIGLIIEAVDQIRGQMSMIAYTKITKNYKNVKKKQK